MLVNARRAHLAEFGIVAGVGRTGLEKLLGVTADDQDARVPPEARECLLALRDHLVLAKRQILDADRRILAWHRASEMSRRLDDIPGVGPLIATALVASIPDPHAFRSGRDLSAWIGLVPKQSSTGGKERLVSTPLACCADGAALDQGRGHCAGQQDRAYRLGHDGPRHTLPRAPMRAWAPGGMRHARARTRAHEVG